MTDVLYVPDLSINLLSVSRIALHGNKIIFDDAGCSIVNGDVFYDPNTIIATESLSDGIYRLNRKEKEISFVTQVEPISNLWHRRLGH